MLLVLDVFIGNYWDVNVRYDGNKGIKGIIFNISFYSAENFENMLGSDKYETMVRLFSAVPDGL